MSVAPGNAKVPGVPGESRLGRPVPSSKPLSNTGTDHARKEPMPQSPYPSIFLGGGSVLRGRLTCLRASVTSTEGRKAICEPCSGPTRRGQFASRRCALRADRPKEPGGTCTAPCHFVRWPPSTRGRLRWGNAPRRIRRWPRATGSRPPSCACHPRPVNGRVRWTAVRFRRYPARGLRPDPSGAHLRET